ncbi:conserved Plasmodium protein, unknown function [Plasmodium berghei]|uniref:Nucleotidyltransferase, putative n=2 Tax=Plasmodium berghei TaxID=5821 RepID=A0A509ATY2_PLABA|nr:nucleotidyltransferase, putative [Plasmodium berghei ANKA]CXI75616.1 conserved Plasmodium protein, unknown function [Plasmodium berghei]SCM24835.1 conserved Plasmodium protein, unknown function [Plasmodium berghei]SCN27183.1 conserved Plasmodium protein, unknown function [Plasmodium berghei]SCO61735.1 conserved Plasmodium protein, unknown function [Plasmodium berghei]SCO63606.1 conserved Plasmodium protein, unknown function [Plasmodium berghei]|eukprot:XP_034422817.1 nucleotidyltransferase, putative [Plasmodium berghei ANKA]
MNVSFLSMISKIIKKNKKIYNLSYCSNINSLPQFTFPVVVNLNFVYQFSTIKNQYIYNDGTYEVNKKIQLTNFKVAKELSDNIINSDESDDEIYILERNNGKKEYYREIEDKNDYSRKINQEKERDSDTNICLHKNNNDKNRTPNFRPNILYRVSNNEYSKMKQVLNQCITQHEQLYYNRDNNKINTLNEELSKLEIELRPSSNDINNIKQFLKILQNEIDKQYKNCHVTPFGSVINGFWMKNSDIDICIQIPILLNRKDQISFLKKICLILNNYHNGIIEQRFSAKVPIIHFYCDDHKNTFQLSCDISVNNILAVINSKLIQKYVSIDKRLQLMGIALKYWSKKRNINDRSKGFLSSFSLILMVIHFLQYVMEPKILTSLQDISIRRNEKSFYVMGVDCKYCQDDVIIREELKRMNIQNGISSDNKNYDHASQVDISTLMLEFFKFYGYKYKSGIIAIRDINNYYENFASLKSYESYYLFVDNPFEIGKNVANILPQNYKTIIYEMKRAYKILKNNGTWEDVCRSTDNLIYS